MPAIPVPLTHGGMYPQTCVWCRTPGSCSAVEQAPLPHFSLSVSPSICYYLQYLQSQLPNGTVPVFANSLCPEACLDMPSTGLFLYTRDQQSAAVKNWCACDPNMLQAAGSELQVCLGQGQGCCVYSQKNVWYQQLLQDLIRVPTLAARPSMPRGVVPMRVRAPKQGWGGGWQRGCMLSRHVAGFTGVPSLGISHEEGLQLFTLKVHVACVTLTWCAATAITGRHKRCTRLLGWGDAHAPL
jgi:hypothetical protein